MNPRTTLVWLVALGFLSIGVPGPAASQQSLLGEFWAAETPGAAQQAAAALTDVDFDAVYRELQAGSLDGDARRGRLVLEHRVDGVRHPYLVYVPENYDAARSYPVRFYLHGGVGRGYENSSGGWWRNPDRLVRDDHIAVFPYSWNESVWWTPSQLENVQRILWRLKRSYNVDDDRVYMFGVSDGGTGAWFFAFRDTTPWAGFLPFIAHPAVLSNPGTGVAGELYATNLTNKPFYVVNGGVDRLYPADAVAPYMQLFEAAGVDLEFVAKPEEGHSTRWWPAEADAIEAFIEANARDPLPDHIAWRSDSAASGRAHWVVIDEIGPPDGELTEFNGVTVRGRRYMAFPRSLESGRLEARRDGNTIAVETWGVVRYRLLLSPEEFDFSEPIVVTTNGEESFRGLVSPDAGVLLKWAARDADRRMLFGAELAIEVAPR